MALDPDFVQRLQNNETIPVATDDFKAMEDELVHELLPYYDRQPPSSQLACEHMWSTRKRLLDDLRGNKFNGRLLNPLVSLQTDPLEVINQQAKLPPYQKRLTADNIFGIEVAAGIKSTSASLSGTIARSIWYIRATMPSNAYNQHRFWLRIVGDDHGSNTIAEALKRAHRSNPHPVAGNGKTSSRHRVANK